MNGRCIICCVEEPSILNISVAGLLAVDETIHVDSGSNEVSLQFQKPKFAENMTAGIVCLEGVVCVEEVCLYSHTQESGFYDIDGNLGPYNHLLKVLNKVDG